MNVSSDAAEQIVRMSLEGMEVVIKLSGQGAKLAAVRLAAALNEDQKTRGKSRLTAMLKSGKPLKVYEIQQKDLKNFAQEAKRYGVLYTVLRSKDKNDTTIDIISRVEDASKIQRITDRFQLIAKDTASVIGEVQKTREETHRGVKEKPVIDVERDKEIMKPIKKDENTVNPTVARTVNDPLSGPNSTRTDSSRQTISNSDKPSVREKLEGYKKEIELRKAIPVKEKEKAR